MQCVIAFNMGNSMYFPERKKIEKKIYISMEKTFNARNLDYNYLRFSTIVLSNLNKKIKENF